MESRQGPLTLCCGATHAQLGWCRKSDITTAPPESSACHNSYKSCASRVVELPEWAAEVLQSRAEWGPHVSKQPWVCAASHAPPRTSHHPCTYCSAILWLPDPAFSLAVMSHFYCLTDLSSPSDWQRSFSQSVPLYEHTLDKPADCPKFHHNVNKALCPLPWVRAVWCASSNAHCAVYSTCLSGWSYLSQSEGSIVEGHVTPLIRGALPQGTAPLLYFLFVGTSLHTIFRPMLSTFLVTVSGQ